jgi:hypothetical protein
MYGTNLERRILIKCCIKLITVISLDNYYSQFYHSFYELVQFLTPSIDQAILPYFKQN